MNVTGCASGLLAALLASHLFAGGASASMIRLANGQPCAANEKTHYGKDGATPEGCEPEGQLKYPPQMREANGKPCFPTEKTYYGTDGKTPYACEPAGGPAYRFEVSVDGRRIWSGTLPQDKPEVHYELPRSSESVKKKYPHLVIKRDLERDPTGRVLYFGEGHVGGIEKVSTAAGGTATSMAFPTLKFVGTSIPTRPGEVLKVDVGAFPGAVIPENKYQLVIYPE